MNERRNNKFCFFLGYKMAQLPSKKRFRDDIECSTSRLQTSMHNLGCYTFFWLRLLCEFIGDLDTILSMRLVMKSTRYMKGNLFARFPIGPYTYDEFLKMNPDLKSTSTVHVAHGGKGYHDYHIGKCRVNNIDNFYRIMKTENNMFPCRVVVFSFDHSDNPQYFDETVCSVHVEMDINFPKMIHLQIEYLPSIQEKLNVKLEYYSQSKKIAEQFGDSCSTFIMTAIHANIEVNCRRDRRLNLLIHNDELDSKLAVREIFPDCVSRYKSFSLNTNAPKIELNDLGLCYIHLADNNLQDLQLFETGLPNLSHLSNLKSLGVNCPSLLFDLDNLKREKFFLPLQPIRYYKCEH